MAIHFFLAKKILNEKSENEVGETNIQNEPKCKYVNKVLEILNQNCKANSGLNKFLRGFVNEEMCEK